jgi:hypothetical protein
MVKGAVKAAIVCRQGTVRQVVGCCVQARKPYGWRVWVQMSVQFHVCVLRCRKEPKCQQVVLLMHATSMQSLNIYPLMYEAW